MKLITTLLIQLIFLVSIHSQNLIAEYSRGLFSDGKKEYKYDEQNRLIEEIRGNFSKTEWVYENDVVVLIRKFTNRSGDWVLSILYENIYDEDGCLSNQIRSFLTPLTGSIVGTITLVNEFDCSDPWKYNPDIFNMPTISLDSRLTRLRTDTSELEIYEDYDESTEEWIEMGVIERKYNQENKLVEHYTHSLYVYGYAQKLIYTYDTTGENITSLEEYSKSHIEADWEGRIVDEYSYGNGLLQKIERSYGDEPYSEISYEYYCDGLLKKKTTNVVGDDNEPGVVNYEYDQKLNDSEDCEQLEQFDLNIYPNPVNGVFYIESDIFQKENSEILIYNTIGKLMYRQQVKDRLQRVAVRVNEDMSSNNMLIVHLIAEGGDKLNKKNFIGKLHR